MPSGIYHLAKEISLKTKIEIGVELPYTDRGFFFFFFFFFFSKKHSS